MNKNQFETVIIGGGQAGLATAYCLTRHCLPCVILDENDKVGAAWRNRWNSLKLFTTSRYSSLPGMPCPVPPRSFPGKDDISDYLQAYVDRFNLPVRTGIKVDGVSFDGNRYTIETNGEPISAYNVVVATGAFHNPRIPGFADKLDTDISYPQLEDGRVLKAANVIWGTGYKADFSWIDLPIFDDYGYPVHKRGVVNSHPGLYFMGLPFQRTLSSTLILGVGKDAEYIANHIASKRAAKERPGWTVTHNQ